MSEPAQKPRRLARIAALVAVFLLIGATVNVLVAWWPCVYLSRADATGQSVTLDPVATWEHGYNLAWGPPDGIFKWQTRLMTMTSAYWSPRSRPWQATISLCQCGFPQRSMQGRFEYSGPPTTQVAIDGYIFALGPTRGALPLRPLWPGFALNTLIYAALGWGLWQLVPAARRRRRKKRNQCAACGYSRAGLTGGAPCPECGSSPA